jgi:hypothetical protein
MMALDDENAIVGMVANGSWSAITAFFEIIDDVKVRVIEMKFYLQDNHSSW